MEYWFLIEVLRGFAQSVTSGNDHHAGEIQLSSSNNMKHQKINETFMNHKKSAFREIYVRMLCCTHKSVQELFE